jgi:hypothetical protein
MSPANNPNDIGAASQTEDRATAAQPVETIYTTVEAQHDRTDWLTVVSNLRQINRQLVEEIARLEQALASANQTLHTKKEENQVREITILQQQDELRISHDRLGALFQQLETSHQIGQRQQTLIETLSQQLEIVRAIVPQIETEHEELLQKYQQQSQKLTKTEQVAVELHRRLKLQTNTIDKPTPSTTKNPTPLPPTTPEIEITPSTEILYPEIARNTSILTTPEILFRRDLDRSNPDLSPLETAIFNSDISTAEIDPAPPQIDEEMPNWTPSAPTPSAKTILSPPKASDPTGWREAIRQERDTSKHRYNYTLEPFPQPTAPSPAAVRKQSTPSEDPISQSAPNWPAPTIDRDALQHSKPDRSIAKKVTIDLPKFPKRPEN